MPDVIGLTAELDEAEAIVMGDAPEPYSCPTQCDKDCEINGWGCHEAHDVPSHREHDPGACEARQLAASLRYLVDAGWKVQFGKHPVPHQGRHALEPYYVMHVADPMFSRIWHGVGPGEALAKARQCAEQESAPDAC